MPRTLVRRHYRDEEQRLRALALVDPARDDVPPDEPRFGHYLLRHYHHFHVDLDEIAVHGNPPGYDWRDERAANDFAAQLLMPAALITQAHKDTPDLDTLAERFRVSRLAMGFRLTHLGPRA